MIMNSFILRNTLKTKYFKFKPMLLEIHRLLLCYFCKKFNPYNNVKLKMVNIES